MCLQEGGGYALQLDVAVGAVDEGMKVAGEMNGMLAASDGEVGNVDTAAGFYVLQCALKLVVGGEHSGDAVEGAEIGILESVTAGNWSLAGIAGIPRAELSLEANLAGRQRSVKGDGVGQGSAAANRSELESMDIEEQRIIGITAINLNGGTIGNDFSDSVGGWSFLPGDLLDGGAGRGDVNAKLSEDDMRDVAGAEEEIGVARLDDKALNGGDGRGVRRAAQAFENEIFSDTSRIRKIGGVKLLECDSDGETLLQGLREARL